jgi:hypothetical protein
MQQLRSYNYNWLYHHTTRTQQHPFYYKFCFITIISPWSLLSARRLLTVDLFKTSNHLYVKQSYLLFTWLYYLVFPREYGLNQTVRSEKMAYHFFVYPKKRQVLTLTKAPIAHKTFSKEQFTFYTYRLTTRFSATLFVYQSTVHHALLLLLLTKKNFPIFETNLLYLKYFLFFYTFSDKTFFQLLL